MNVRRILVFVMVLVLAAGCGSPDKEESRGAVTNVAEILGGQDSEGYARADSIRTFHFPEDHGPHPEFRTEWWYFTGNLLDDRGRRYGFQFTAFRLGLSPQAPDRESAWATNQVYMAHLAITDANRKEFHGFERFSRGAVGLAGAQSDPVRVWLEDWELAGREGGGFPWMLEAQSDGVGISLSVEPVKDIVLQGDHGLSRKGPEPGNASYYYSIMRLDAAGSLTVAGQEHEVTGTAWLDREWSTSALGAGQVGWDWFALQFDDGTDVMYYQLRREDGTPDSHSQGTVVDPDGGMLRLSQDDVRLEVLDTWRSPQGGEYPLKWRMDIQPLGQAFVIETVLEGQEQNLSVRYWEGAVDILDVDEVDRLGWGYMELTSYGDGNRQ